MTARARRAQDRRRAILVEAGADMRRLRGPRRTTRTEAGTKDDPFTDALQATVGRRGAGGA